jgi:hypothetical protein
MGGSLNKGFPYFDRVLLRSLLFGEGGNVRSGNGRLPHQTGASFKTSSA